MAIFNFTITPPKCACDTTSITLASPTAELFDGVAQMLAMEMSEPEMLVQKDEWNERERRKTKVWKVISDKDANKPTQIRKFYDEVIMWSEKTRTIPDLERNLPFIKMMNAKVAYARGRELVDDKFVTWFSSCLSQIKAADEAGLAAFQSFRTLFEAFVGFYKVARPK